MTLFLALSYQESWDPQGPWRLTDPMVSGLGKYLWVSLTVIGPILEKGVSMSKPMFLGLL